MYCMFPSFPLPTLYFPLDRTRVGVGCRGYEYLLGKASKLVLVIFDFCKACRLAKLDGYDILKAPENECPYLMSKPQISQRAKGEGGETFSLGTLNTANAPTSCLGITAIFS